MKISEAWITRALLLIDAHAQTRKFTATDAMIGHLRTPNVETADHGRLRRALALIENEPDTASLYSASCELRAVLGMHARGVGGTDGR